MALTAIATTAVATKTINTTLLMLGSSLKYIMQSEQPSVTEIQAELEKMDLTNKISILESLMEDLHKKNMNEPVNKSISAVDSILKSIHIELNEIQQRLINHNNKWFSGWRSLNCSSNILKIKGHNNILDNRVDMLIKLISIYKN